MVVKVCGMKYKENIKDVLALKPDMMGFIFYEKSPRCADKETKKVLRESDFGKTKKVGVFVNETTENILSIAKDCKLDMVQLHGNESPEAAALIQKHYPVIKAIGIENKENFRSIDKYEGKCNYILLDKKSPSHGGTGKVFDWNLLTEYNYKTPFLLSGGISPENISAAKNIKHSSMAGIDVNSGFEDAPGLKNIEKLKKL